MFNLSKFWAVKQKTCLEIELVEIRILRWMKKNILVDKIRNACIH